LNDQERVIYDSLFLDGDNKMSNPQLAAKLNVKVSNLTYMKTQIRKKVVQFKKSLGK
jgi:transcriptional antiterminator